MVFSDMAIENFGSTVVTNAAGTTVDAWLKAITIQDLTQRSARYRNVLSFDKAIEFLKLHLELPAQQGGEFDGRMTLVVGQLQYMLGNNKSTTILTTN